MNERLKHHFQQYLDENEGIFYPEQTARHFYLLALADVKKEIEKLQAEMDEQVADLSDEYLDGFDAMGNFTLDFIDNIVRQ